MEKMHVWSRELVEQYPNIAGSSHSTKNEKIRNKITNKVFLSIINENRKSISKIFTSKAANKN